MNKFTGDIANALKTLAGQSFWIKKTVTSSAILTTPVAITSPAIGGELAIEDIVIQTDGTGLSTGTTFRIVSDNAKGTVGVFITPVARLGARVQRTMNSEFNYANNVAGTLGVNQPVVLEIGKKLSVQNTDAASTGSGTIDIFVKFRRVKDGARILAA